MPDRYVLDSSIIAAIFFQEEASSRAVKAVQDQDLLTLDLALSEVGNVAWKRITLFGEDEEVIEEAFKKGVKFITTACEVIKTQELIDISFKIAVKEKHELHGGIIIIPNLFYNFFHIFTKKSKNFSASLKPANLS